MIIHRVAYLLIHTLTSWDKRPFIPSIIQDAPVRAQIFQAPAWGRQRRMNIASPVWTPHHYRKNSWLPVPVLSWHTSLIKSYVIAWWKSTATSLSLRSGCAFPINLAQSWFNAAACRYPNPAVWERFFWISFDVCPARKGFILRSTCPFSI